MQKAKIGVDELETELLIRYVVKEEEYEEALPASGLRERTSHTQHALSLTGPGPAAGWAWERWLVIKS